MWQALVTALRARGVDVQTALDAEMIERTDEDHLVFAMTQGRVLCSFNVGDFFASTRITWHSTKHILASFSLVSSSTLSESTCVVCSD